MSATNKEFNISFAKGCDSLCSQLKSQRVRYVPKTIKEFQWQMNSIMYLRDSKFLNEKEFAALCERLLSKIKVHIFLHETRF